MDGYPAPLLSCRRKNKQPAKVDDFFWANTKTLETIEVLFQNPNQGQASNLQNMQPRYVREEEGTAVCQHQSPLWKHKPNSVPFDLMER